MQNNWLQNKNSWLLFAFVLVYTLVFFPGTLFYKPIIIMPQVNTEASENFLYLPKLLFLLVCGVLGVLEIRKQLPNKPFVWLLCAHGLLVVLSLINARDTLAYNLLGPAQRFDGFLYHLGLIAMGIYAYTQLQNALQLRFISIALVISACLQAVIVEFQGFGLDFITPLRLWQKYSEPLGTLGHPGMVASFLLVGLLVAFWYSLKEPLWLWKVGVFIIALGLGFCSNSASFYSLLGTFLCANLVYRQPRFLFASLVVVGLVILPRVLPISIPESSSYTSTTTLQTRLLIWQIAFKVISSTPLQPLLGGGSDGMVLGQLRNPPLELLSQEYALEYSWPKGWPKDAKLTGVRVQQSNLPGATLRDQSMVFDFANFNGKPTSLEYRFNIDRAHNFWLDRWVAFGLINALLWLFLYLYALWKSWQTKHWIGWVILAMGAYYLFWFPVMQVEPIHLVLLAAAWAAKQEDTHV
jgi:hypothetical protein